MNAIIYICKIIWISIILFLTTCSVNGQVKKTKQLIPSDYALWSTLNAEGISDQGTWASYSLSYQSGLDTLFVQNTVAAQKFIIEKGYDGKFINEKWFGCIVRKNQFQLLNLITGNVQKYENVQEFSFTNNNKYVMLFSNEPDGKSKIIIRDLSGNSIESISNVTSYNLSPNGNSLAYCTSRNNEKTVGLFEFAKQTVKKIIIRSTEREFENIIWQVKGNSIAFVSRLITSKPFTADTVLFYKIGNGKLFQYDTTIEKSWSQDKILDANYTSSLRISDDGQQVFFNIKNKPDKNNIKNDLDVQVWNAADSDLFTLRNDYGSAKDNPRLVSWQPQNNYFSAIADDKHSAVIITTNQQFALVYNPDANKPTFKQEADRDYYLLDLKTNEKTLFLKQQSASTGNLYFSPTGKYIVYFRERNWWMYSFEAKLHTNLTLYTNVPFYDSSNDIPEEPNPYGYAGFTANDESVLLYEQFDIWRFNLGNKSSKRLTSGRDKDQIFRLSDMETGNMDNLVYKDKAINIRDSILLKTQSTDNSESGYYKLNGKQQLQLIAYESKLINSLYKAKARNSYIYVQQDFNQPPALMIKKGNALPMVIYKSNPQHDYYHWGDSQLIAYKNSKGVILKGVLFYPFNYNPRQQYPMIVSIYQRQTKALHSYVNPSLLNGSAFNVTYYTSLGYFVLLPDIIYEIGNPGYSASDCVIAATNSIIETGLVDNTKIGLIGHSFGGYEVYFSITQTGLFAAAVGGSGVSDFTSGYLSMNREGKNSNSWRYEYQQLRMGKTLFEDYKSYQNNSPVSWVSNVTTPLLSYSGTDDKNVDLSQSMEFYLALRRLKKEHIMLLYHKEGHTMQGHENQIDLTYKISEWFGYYLKGEKKPDWFEPK